MRVSGLFALAAFAGAASAQPLRSLKGVPVPAADLSRFVSNRSALVTLGKAFFWDMQAGSDGKTACATCHFHAGADHRSQNQLADPQFAFPLNLKLNAEHFPLRVIADSANRNSTVLRDSSMRVGSAGVFRRNLRGIVPGEAAEIAEDALDRPEFILSGLQVRSVTARNTPSVINAAFYVEGFWDGRAERFFNGFTPAGLNAAPPGILAARGGLLEREQVRIDFSSLASQAVGPAMDQTEMSYAGRSWPLLGKKLMNRPPLALQKVARDDSVFGSMANADGRGLRPGITYRSLIEAAFRPAYWESQQLVDEAGNVLPGRQGVSFDVREFTQAEYNFSFFWGLALQAYQATLISDDSPLDRFLAGEAGALSREEQDGMQFFQNAGRCTTCHGGAELSSAAFSGNRGRAFQQTGVRPLEEDLGRGNGSFKSVTVRNVEFTGPYFHNGGQSTLEQLIEFYARGGDFPNNGLRAFNASPAQRAALVAFMKALSDERVRHERAPFDHPELCVPAGHRATSGESAGYPRSAEDVWIGVPAVGASGNGAPLQTFEELLRGIGADGSRAHSMTDACAVPLPD